LAGSNGGNASLPPESKKSFKSLTVSLKAMSRKNSLILETNSKSQNKQVADWWSDAGSAVPNIHWYQAPKVINNMNQRATNDSNLDWLNHSAIFLETLPKPRKALSLACGFGVIERNLRRLDICQEIHGVDLSQGAIDGAKENAIQAGLNGLNYVVLDLNTAILPPDQYDVIYANAALHHIFELEHLLKQLNRTLKKDGYLIIFDYFGPTALQFPQPLLALSDVLLRAIPREYRRLRRWEGYKDEAFRLSLQMFQETDPSECIRAAELIPLIENHFKINYYRELGGTLLIQLLNEIWGNFPEDDPILNNLQDWFICLENVLIDSGVFPSYHAYLVCQKTEESLSAPLPNKPIANPTLFQQYPNLQRLNRVNKHLEGIFYERDAEITRLEAECNNLSRQLEDLQSWASTLEQRLKSK
jgi:SAM-dependent methyltransferase